MPQRDAVRARVLDERSYAEIAGEMDCSEAVVHQRVPSRDCARGEVGCGTSKAPAVGRSALTATLDAVPMLPYSDDDLRVGAALASAVGRSPQ